MGQILRAFARRQHDRVVRDAVLVEAPAQRREVMARDLLVGDNDRLPSPQQRQHRGAGGLDQAGADENVVASLRKRDAQALGCGLISVCHGSLSTSGGRDTERTVRERGNDARRRLFRRAVAAVDDDIGLGIDRMAPLDQLREHRSRIAALQQGPVVAAGYPRDQHVEIGAQPYRDAPPCDPRAGGRVHERAPAGREDMRRLLQQPRDDAALAVAKHALPRGCGRFPRSSRRRRPRSRYPNRRTAGSAGSPSAVRSLSCPRPSGRRERSSAAAIKPARAPPFRSVGWSPGPKRASISVTALPHDAL